MPVLDPAIPAIGAVAGEVEGGSGDVTVEETRRAMVSSAMKGITRFKQSWISAVILKGGIGLGQVS
jgi:hypothetical protein